MLPYISTKYPKKFNDYLILKIKDELKKHSKLFNPSFIFRNKVYHVSRCIDSLICNNEKIYFKYDYPVRHLVYNNRQLYWLYILQKYQNNIGKEFLLWRAKKKNRK